MIYSMRSNLFALLLGLFAAIQSGHCLIWKMPPDVFSPGPFANYFDLAADINGNAFTTWTDDTGLFVSRFSNTTQSYGPPVTIVGGNSNIVDVQVTTDATGTALLIWADASNGTLSTSFFNGSTWVTPTPSPLDIALSGFTFTPQIAMNGSGSGLAIWSSSIPSGSLDIKVSFFNPGTVSWGPLQTLNQPGIPNFGFDPSVDYSPNGTAVAVWRNVANDIVASNFNGTTWTAVPPSIGTNGSPPKVQIDASGNALALWYDIGTGEVFSSFYNGAWGAPESVSDGQTPFNFDFDMSPGGYAIAVWSDGTNGFYSEFIAGSWTAPLPFSTDAVNARVAVDSSGNALIAFNTVSGDGPAYSIYKPFGGPLGAPDLVAAGSSLLTVDIVDLSDNGRGFVDGGIIPEFGVSGTYTLINPPPPVISGSVCTNKFATQSDRIHIITWIPSPDPTVTFYRLRRNGELIAIIPASGPFVYYDHNRCHQTDVYTLTAVSPSGESVPAIIALR